MLPKNKTRSSSSTKKPSATRKKVIQPQPRGVKNKIKNGLNRETTSNTTQTSVVPVIQKKKKRTVSHKKGFFGSPLSTENLLDIANQVNQKIQEQVEKKQEVIHMREAVLQEKEAKVNARKMVKENRIQEIKAQILQKENHKKEKRKLDKKSKAMETKRN
ncbi:hypothetical protein HMI56_002779 [Coelomomyces lativittatus]|nr:hypothetical protein HMI56_002779 [Coelomomyces lativittatus]